MKNGTGLQNNLNKVWFLYDNCHCNDPWKKHLPYEKRKTHPCWQPWQRWLQQWLDRLQFKAKTDFYHDSKNCWTFLRWVRIVHWQAGLEKTLTYCLGWRITFPESCPLPIKRVGFKYGNQIVPNYWTGLFSIPAVRMKKRKGENSSRASSLSSRIHNAQNTIIF